MIGIGVAGICLAILFARGPWRWRCVALACGVVVDPLVALAALMAVIAGERLTLVSRNRREHHRIREDEILAVELVAAGVEAGVSFDLAVGNAASFVDPDVGFDLRRMLRQARHGHGPPTAPSVTAEMIRIAIGSEVSGAAISDQLAALAESELASDEAAINERMARLPVKMLFPLALLILPGFLLVAVAPAVIGGIARLGL